MEYTLQCQIIQQLTLLEPQCGFLHFFNPPTPNLTFYVLQFYVAIVFYVASLSPLNNLLNISSCLCLPLKHNKMLLNIVPLN